ncbi:hypothetical protein [Acinetobacter shaoyimingii]|uniref:Uncharacterized protein n=1 Tax=Acinetobacter shaoyimingii TaxID=2715164 RepID=A0A6G8RWW0_9GAMM|nr:hypothetical protein [Acinetobacter shaoyimingii]QIO06377.1 hypothetical protein G8E00_10645 [Acinetobacter shaoyimingii]
MVDIDKHDGQDVMIQLPWVVPIQPTVSTHIVAETNQSRVPLDLNVSSTDWLVAGSIIVSGLISVLGFFTTIYVVRKSTQENIFSNQNLIKSQIEIKVAELRILSGDHKLAKFRDSISHYYQVGMEFNNQCITSIEVIYHLNKLNEIENIRDKIKSKYFHLCSAAHGVFVYFDFKNENDKFLKDELFQIMKLAWSFYSELGIDEKKSSETLDKIAKKFGNSQMNLNQFIKEKEKCLYAWQDI